MLALESLFAAIMTMALLPGSGEPRPDFSGHWTLSIESSTIDPRIGAGLERGVVEIVHRESSVAFRRTFTAKGRDDRSDYELTPDGAEKTRAEGAITRHSRLAWDGDALVLTERLVAPQGEASNIVRYRLLDAGRTLEAREQFRGPRLQYDNVWVFRR